MPKFAAVSSTYLMSRHVCFENIFSSELVNISLNIYTCARRYDQIDSCPVIFHIYLTSRHVCFENILNSALVNISLNIYIRVPECYDQIYSCPVIFHISDV